MASSDFLDNYNLVGPTIRKLYDSSLRLAIIDALSENPMRLADLRREVDANAPNTSAKAKELEEIGVLERVEGDYQLTEWGHATLKQIRDCVKLHAVMTKFKEYWDTHTIEGVPEHMRYRLGVYSTAKLIKPKADDIDWVDRHFIEVITKARKRFWGLTPVFRPDYMEAIMGMVQKGTDVQIILEEPIVLAVLKLIPPEALKSLEKVPNLKFFVIKEKLSLGFCFGDDFCTIGFKSKKDPSTYMDMNLESYDKKCVDFQTEMFKHFMKKAEPINVGDYL